MGEDKMNTSIYRAMLIFVLMILSSAIVFGTIQSELSDQGTGVRARSEGTLLATGNLSVEIWDSPTAGAIVYNETFTNAIVNGSWNVMLGENAPLYLQFNKKYYKDYKINGEDVSFTNSTGGTIARQTFYSPLGELGSDTNASGSYSVAMGYNTTASNTVSTAMGANNVASGVFSTAIGDSNVASGWASTGMGSQNTASGDYSTAMGIGTTANGVVASTAMGANTISSGFGSFAVGIGATASGSASIATGVSTNASGNRSTAMGSNSIAGGVTSTAIGDNVKAIGDQSVALGFDTYSGGTHATALGAYTNAGGYASTAMGSASKASADYSFAWGGDNCQYVDSTMCNNTRSGVFAVFGGLCVAGATNACPNIPDGTIDALNYSIGGTAGITQTISLNGTSGTCTLTITGGIITGTTC